MCKQRECDSKVKSNLWLKKKLSFYSYHSQNLITKAIIQSQKESYIETKIIKEKRETTSKQNGLK